jgi:hypothetical protein
MCTFWLLWPVVKSQSALIKPSSGSQPPTTENTSHIDSDWVLTSQLDRKCQNTSAQNRDELKSQESQGKSIFPSLDLDIQGSSLSFIQMWTGT